MLLKSSDSNVVFWHSWILEIVMFHPSIEAFDGGKQVTASDYEVSLGYGETDYATKDLLYGDAETKMIDHHERSLVNIF